ncbi:uncharacterized protein LOC113295296 [Papaver somniferum]|uniref:uncharacterized protein LOC113295296 n=1 Tax=Papaver somniferum TaxID=3469 RepID=UPI000E701DFE|nr:uncharacterized protein LOC113295296 [Papaver somniferum]
MKLTTECEVRMKAIMWNTSYDLQILKTFGMKFKKIKACAVQEVSFILPQKDQLLICCDGASRGNPGESSYGFISRNNEGECVIAITRGIGVARNFYAEIMAVLCAGEWAMNNGFRRLLFRSDSKTVIEAFKNCKLPWFS